MVVRSTLTHCAGVHTVCGEGAQGTFVESVRVGKYQVCGVCKMALLKNLAIPIICIVFRSENHRMGAFEFEIELFFKLNLLNVKLCAQF